MSEWTVVTVIIALVGLLAAVLKPLLSLNGTIARLTEVVKELEKDISGFDKRNNDSHGKIWERVRAHNETIINHETRLTVIESAGK